MSLDLLIPFGILLIMVVYLIYSRNNFEKDIVKLYEEKLEEWKKHSTNEKEALCTENKTLCFPASADSIPTSLGQEDHVSMGSIS